MGYWARDGNWYDHKETPSEYDARHGYDGGYPSLFWIRLRTYTGFLAVLCLVGGCVSGFFLFWMNVLLCIIALGIYRLARWDAWERKWLFFVVTILMILQSLAFLLHPALAIGMCVLSSTVIVLDIMDIAIFIPFLGDKLQTYTGFLAVLCLVGRCVSGFFLFWMNVLLCLIALGIYRLARWDARERKWLFFVIAILMILQCLALLLHPALAIGLCALCSIAMALDIMDIAIFTPFLLFRYRSKCLNLFRHVAELFGRR